MKTLSRVEQIELERNQLEGELEKIEDKVYHLRTRTDYISERIEQLNNEEAEIYKLSVIEAFKEFAANKYPNGYTIYFISIRTDFLGDSKYEYVIWDNSVNSDIFEEMFKDMIEEMNSELGLKIAEYYYKYDKVELEDLPTYVIKRLMQKYS